MIPMSTEGFMALATEVSEDINDIDINHTLERLGLPPATVRSFLSRTITSLAAEHDATLDNGQLLTTLDVFIVGVLVGHKAGEWGERARTN